MSSKRQLFDELVAEVRRSQTATDRFDHAVADALGVNRTDLRCLDVLEREGGVTAGRLAQVTGLTTGSITIAIDRLEQRGLAHRRRDPADRRRVLVELDPAARARAGALYAAQAELSDRLYRRYTEAQIELLIDFVRQGRELNEQQAAALERRNRDALDE